MKTLEERITEAEGALEEAKASEDTARQARAEARLDTLKEAKEFHTKEFERVGKKIRSEGGEALLKKLGVETEEEAERLVTEYRTIQDATKDDFTRLEEERDTLRSEKETVASERDSLKTRAEKSEEVLKKDLEKRMEGIPDHIKSLLGGMDPVDQHAWLTENQEALGTQVTPLPTTPDGAELKPKGVAKSYMDKKYGTQAS